MNKKNNLTVMLHTRFLDHKPMDVDHPETPDRITVIMDRLLHGPLREIVHVEKVSPIDKKILSSFHDESYIMRFEEACLSGKSHLGHPDNQICYDTFTVSLFSAGAGIKAVDLAATESTGKFFCPVRPPGHHAEPAHAFGFCFFNNIVLAGRHWQIVHGKKKILIIDFDAHHGNGIQTAAEIFPDWFYISIHEHPAYSFPGTGYSDESTLHDSPSWILNLPMQPGTKDDTVLEVMTQRVLPAVEKFKPDAILVAAGFDGHILDDMSGLHYSTGLYGILGAMIADIAEKNCNGKIITFLEGGYHLPTLAESVESFLAGLTGVEV